MADIWNEEHTNRNITDHLRPLKHGKVVGSVYSINQSIQDRRLIGILVLGNRLD